MATVEIPSAPQGNPLSIVGYFDALGRAAAALAYCGILVFTYHFMSGFWAYIGLRDIGLSVSELALLCILAACPALLLSSTNNNLGHYIVWIVYYTVCIPSILIPPMQAFSSSGRILLDEGLVFIATIILIVGTRNDGHPLRMIRIRREYFWTALLTMWAILNLFVIFAFGNILHLASFAEVYDQRYLGAAVADTSYIAYLIGALTGAFNPFLISVGVTRRKWLLLALGLLSQILMYMTVALRAVLLSTILIPAAALLLVRRDSIQSYRVGYGMLAISIAMLGLLPFYTLDGSLLSDIVSLVVVRTLEMPGVLFGAYSDFFSQYPITLYSHSIVGRYFSSYPYGNLQIGQVIGQYLVQDQSLESLDANAHFMATDGVAALGWPGIVTSSIFLMFLLRGLSRLLGNVDRRVLCGSFIPVIISITNSSVLTSTLTGGGFLLTVLLYFWHDGDRAEGASEPA